MSVVTSEKRKKQPPQKRKGRAGPGSRLVSCVTLFILLVAVLLAGAIFRVSLPSITPTAIPDTATPVQQIPTSAPVPPTAAPVKSDTPGPVPPLPTTPAAPTEVGVVTSNRQWRVTYKDFDGVTMALVPPGCFEMGSNNSNHSEERPVNRVCFSAPFWIDKTQVTQAQFKQFGGIAKYPPNTVGDLQPVEMISWYEAGDFCAKRGARLPTEAEWEYVARGPDSLEYPWGNAWDASIALNPEPTRGVAYVGSNPKRVSWVGAMDMGGNVYEWTSSLLNPYPYNKDDGRENYPTDVVFDSAVRTSRGGSVFYANEDGLRGAFRTGASPLSYGGDSGFRCARS